MLVKLYRYAVANIKDNCISEVRQSANVLYVRNALGLSRSSSTVNNHKPYLGIPCPLSVVPASRFSNADEPCFMQQKDDHKSSGDNHTNLCQILLPDIWRAVPITASATWAEEGAFQILSVYIANTHLIFSYRILIKIPLRAVEQSTRSFVAKCRRSACDKP